MQWIKRNLFLVLGGVVALGLLGFAGYYLYAKMQQDSTVTGELDAATQRLEALAKRDPYPNPENISAAKEEGKRLQGFLAEVEEHFQPPPLPQELNAMEFRTYLDNTRARLLTEATRAGVEIPTNYWFTFAAQKGSMSFSPATLEPLASALSDVRAICNVLFDAKVNSLVWLKRVPIDSQESTMGSSDYLNAKPTTNAFAIVTPYEVAFQGFSSELAAVLEGLRALPQCYIVTNIVVEPAATASNPAEDLSQTGNLYNRYYPMGGAGSMPNRYGMDPRYGRMPRMMPQPVAPPPQPRPAARGPSTLLDEKPLRFTLSMQAVKLKPRK